MQVVEGVPVATSISVGTKEMEEGCAEKTEGGYAEHHTAVTQADIRSFYVESGMDVDKLCTATQLDLSARGLRDQQVEAFAHELQDHGGTPQLTLLDLSGNKMLTCRALQALVAVDFTRLMHRLVVLNLSGPSFAPFGSITDIGAIALACTLQTAPLCQLQELSLAFNRIGDASISALCNAFASCKCLRNFDGFHNSWSSDSSRMLSHELEERCGIVSLVGDRLGDMMAMRSTGFTDADVSLIAATLRIGDANATLEALDVRGVAVSTVTTVELASSLSGATALRIIQFDRAQVSDEGAEAISMALAKGLCPELAELRMAGNAVGDRFAATMRALFHGAPHLARVALSENAISNSDPIADALECAASLLELLLACNKITSVARLTDALAANAAPRLIKFDISGNPATQASGKLFSKTQADKEIKALKVVCAKRQRRLDLVLTR
mmetsp:Transcript_23759/g.39262  ORF Transcript_23759/g.39262 Transcript_23759/m.39262 type:complete len:443 (+) Transcript_23759:137-1465(+)|eukprot:CAMPEP_0119322712 /NCGR_PEP_ID=MMETSP1333-20130426/58985_1 /TAXON_ID=418940 /ORGANISM="Scyphosphaera apsteinii, Strain RCC1455" /LENGTH=442 /DNA_ID=CAMNT_0007330007 /DNA_START=121 /DNA_END=1449 /DNA_ORIENTATION=+